MDSARVPGNEPLRTFIVEDSPVILDNLTAALHELARVRVIGSAADEAAAVRWLGVRGNDCDLLVIDIFLKSGSGLGVLAHAARAGLAAKRVVLTNFASPDMRQRCERLGAHRVFDKSNEVDELIAYCQQVGTGGAGFDD
jgi:DNA-binding NarL/FixJ family response regulator